MTGTKGAWTAREWLLTVALAAAVLVAVVGLLPPSPSPDGGKVLTPIRLGAAPAAELLLPTLVGMTKGYFEDQALRVEDLFIGPGTESRTALLSGDLDAGLLAFVHVPLARTKDQELKIVAAVYNREIFSVVARIDLRGQVTEIADLRGRRIGVAKVGAGNWAAISSYLSKAGLDPETDVEFINVGNNLQTVYSALKTGRIDAYPSFEPQTTRLVEEGVAFPVLSIWEHEAHKKWVGESAMAMVVGVREETIQQNAELVQKIVNAQKLGLLYIRNHSEEDIAGLILSRDDVASHLGNIDRQTLVSVLQKIKANFGTGALDRRGYETQMNVYATTGVLDRAVSFDEATDWTFAGVTP